MSAELAVVPEPQDEVQELSKGEILARACPEGVLAMYGLISQIVQHTISQELIDRYNAAEQPDDIISPRLKITLTKGTRIGNVKKIERSTSPSTYLGSGIKLGDGAEIRKDAVINEGAEVGDNSIIHEGAQLLPGARIGNESIIGETVIIGSMSQIGNGVEVFGIYKLYKEKTSIGANCKVGDRTKIGPHSALDDYVSLGSDNQLYPSVKMKQKQRTGNRVSIGEGSTLGEHTVIEDDVKIGYKAKLAGQNKVGARSVIGDEAVLRREAQVGRRSTIGAGVKLGRLSLVGDDVFVHPDLEFGDLYQITDGQTVTYHKHRNSNDGVIVFQEKGKKSKKLP